MRITFSEVKTALNESHSDTAALLSFYRELMFNFHSCVIRRCVTKREICIVTVIHGQKMSDKLSRGQKKYIYNEE